MTTDDRTWITPGTPVVGITDGWHDPLFVFGGPDHVPVTITKVGKRDIVLSNGRRFNVDRLTETGDRRAWIRLHAADSDAARKVVADEAEVVAWNRVRSVSEGVTLAARDKNRDALTAAAAALTAAIEALPAQDDE